VVVDATGRSKGFAYVEFADAAGVQAALALDGTMVAGKRIRVQISNPTSRKPLFKPSTTAPSTATTPPSVSLPYVFTII
jgi:RNA recognition motif-containing protein